MGLVRIALLLLVPVWALCLLTRRRAAECTALCVLGLAAGAYVLSLFSALGAGVWILRGLWLACAGFIAVSLYRRRAAARPDITLLLAAAGMALLWWIARGREYSIWDEYSHWGTAVKCLFQEGRLISIVPCNDHFPEYPPALAPFMYMCMRAAGYGFREDLTIFLQGVFLLALLLYPARACAARRNPIALAGSLVLMLCAPLLCYPTSYTGILVDSLLGVLAGFIVLTAVLGDSGRTELVLAGLAAFVLAGAVKLTGIVFALAAALAFACVWLRQNRRQPLSRRLAGALVPAGAAAAGRLSWAAFVAAWGIQGRWTASGFSWAALTALLVHGEPAYRVTVLHKFWANIAGDFNYGTFIHFPYLVWLPLLAAAFGGVWLAARRLEAPRRRGMTAAFWIVWVFVVLYTFSVLFSYLFMFAEGEAVSLASLSRYLNTPVTMLAVVLCGCFAAVLAQYRWQGQLAGIAAGLLFWLEAASPSSLTLVHAAATAPQQAAATINYNRSYRTIAAALQALDDPDACNVFFVSQEDYGFTNLIVDYVLFPDIVTDHNSSVTIRPTDDTQYTVYDSPEAWADMLADNFHYLCLQNVNDAFVQDFSGLFDDPAQVRNGSLFRVERRADGSVHFALVETLNW